MSIIDLKNQIQKGLTNGDLHLESVILWEAVHAFDRIPCPGNRDYMRSSLLALEKKAASLG